MSKFDEDIKKAIEKGTDSIANKKDNVWDNIQDVMETNNMSNKRKPTIIKRIGLIAAAAIVVGGSFVAFTPAGQASFAKFIEMFAPEKPVEIELEGEKETGDYELHTNEVATPEPSENGEKPETNPQKGVSYAIYVDKENYEIVSENGVDTIVPIGYPADMPEVSMTIRQVSDKDINAVSSQIQEELKAEYDTVLEAREVDMPVKGIMIMTHDGLENPENDADAMKWDSAVAKTYLVDNGDGGTFIITAKYFLEAEEGHGSRLSAMLNEFTVVPTE